MFFISFIFFFIMCVCHPPWSHCHRRAECEHVSFLTQSCSVAPQKGESADIHCQGPTAEIFMATHEYGCIFKSSLFHLSCLPWWPRQMQTNTFFLLHYLAPALLIRPRLSERYRCPPLPFVEAAPRKVAPNSQPRVHGN